MENVLFQDLTPKLTLYEEKLLIKAFGSAYGEYMRKVPMFLPIKNIKR